MFGKRCMVCKSKIKRGDGAYADMGLCRSCGEDIQFRQVALTLLREKPETAQRILERDPPASPLQAALRRQFIKMAEERREAGAGDTSPGA